MLNTVCIHNIFYFRYKAYMLLDKIFCVSMDDGYIPNRTIKLLDYVSNYIHIEIPTELTNNKNKLKKVYDTNKHELS